MRVICNVPNVVCDVQKGSNVCQCTIEMVSRLEKNPKMRIVTLKPVVEEYNDKIMCTFSSWVRQNSRGHSL